MRLLAAAVTAGATSLVFPVAMGVWVFLGGPGVDASGRPDNDPYHAAGMLLMLTPAFLLAAATYFLVAASVLGRLGKLTLSTLVVLSAAVSVVLGVVLTADGVQVWGLRDAAIMFLHFSVSSFVSLALGSLVYWRLKPAA